MILRAQGSADRFFGLHESQEFQDSSNFAGCSSMHKYKALREAQLGLPINATTVEAVLVANCFDQPTLDFANEYGIRIVTLTSP